MADNVISLGKGRTRVTLQAWYMGNDIVVTIFNQNAHIGAVAIGEYSSHEDRTSVSVITRLGHKDDVIAQEAAYIITKHSKRASCVIAGIHLDNIVESEIKDIKQNCSNLVSQFIQRIAEISG